MKMDQFNAIERADRVIKIRDCLLMQGRSEQLIHPYGLDDLGIIDAVVTDPPYGIAAARMTMGSGKLKEFEKKALWDEERIDIKHFVKRAKQVIVWGGNYYTDMLPFTNDWLVWDKANTGTSFSEVELAWTNLGCNARILRHHWGETDGKKLHITQKPQRVMEWCLSRLKPPVRTILDPFMGSGTTGVACAHFGLKFIGIELGDHNFQLACERIKHEYEKGDLFRDIQLDMFEEENEL